MAELNIPLIVFTLLIGLSTGTFLLFALWQASGIPSEEVRKKLSRQVMPLLLVCVGIALLASATHLGKPFRFLNAFHNLGSMIAQEGIWSIALGIILLIATVLAFKDKKIPEALYIIGSFISCGLILVCSLVYVRANGFPAWSNGITIVYYFGSAVLLGVAVVYALNMQQTEEKANKKMAFVALTTVCAQIIVSLAFFLQLHLRVMDVVLPSTIGLDIVRWGIGLITPAVIAYLAMNGKMSSKSTAKLFLVCVVVGEVFSRLIFFTQGVHL
ncbi:dimethyl sulfoxide reductase anchor subunit family protein [Desulfitobacterium sp. AusDCA]|uniref:dimethyl sulfoxide reductase anchor subunit family protein n=1 Tax=Desulfitobacterium sp. AusDCA TaxID=3240383 RepID=UPI003DA73C6D